MCPFAANVYHATWLPLQHPSYAIDVAQPHSPPPMRSIMVHMHGKLELFAKHASAVYQYLCPCPLRHCHAGQYTCGICMLCVVLVLIGCSSFCGYGQSLSHVDVSVRALLPHVVLSSLNRVVHSRPFSANCWPIFNRIFG
jgi:hypothetical protein